MLVPAFVVHDVAAVIIILVILAIIVLGIISFLKLTIVGARRARSVRSWLSPYRH